MPNKANEKAVRKAMKVEAPLESFLANVKRLLGSHLSRILLFGSRARGDAMEDSDYDLLIITSTAISPRLREAIDDLGSRTLLEHGAVIYTILLTEEELANRKFEPFIRNALREAKVLL